MKKLFDIIKLYWGYIATVAAIAGSAWGLKSDIEKKAIKEYSGQVKERSYEGKIDKLIKADSLKTITLQELKVHQTEIINAQTEHMNYEGVQEKRFKALEGSYTDFLQIANRLDLYVKYLESQKSENEKKNSMTVQRVGE
jgi:hypothetical protein